MPNKSHDKHRSAILAKVTDTSRRPAAHADHRAEFEAQLKTPGMTRLFDLLERDDETAKAEGNARLKTALLDFADTVEHFIEYVTAKKVPVPPELLAVQSDLATAAGRLP